MLTALTRPHMCLAWREGLARDLPKLTGARSETEVIVLLSASLRRGFLPGTECLTDLTLEAENTILGEGANQN